jgi:hypothetical protein
MLTEQRTALESAQRQMRDLMASDLSLWPIHYIKNGVECYVHQLDDGIPQALYRGRGLIKGGYTIEEILGVIRSFSARKVWDDKLDNGSILERFSFNENVARVQRKGMLTVSGREFVTLNAVERVPEDKVIRYVMTSDLTKNHSDQSDSNLVQAHLYLGGWQLKTLPDGSVQTDYVVRVDVGGSIPGALMEFLQLASLGCIAKIQEYLDSRGPVPFVIHRSHDAQFGAIQCIHEAFESKTPQSFELQLSNSGSQETYVTIALPRLTYPFVQVHVSGLTDSQRALIRIKSLEEFGSPRDLSSATGWILYVPFGVLSTISLQVRPTSKSHNVNGESLGKKDEPLKLEQAPRYKQKIAGPVAFPLVESLLSRIDWIWDSAVDATASALKASRPTTLIRKVKCSCESAMCQVQCTCVKVRTVVTKRLLPQS